MTDSWLDGHGPDKDVVISSRVRIARNYAGLPFPHMMDEAAESAADEKTHVIAERLSGGVCERMSDMSPFRRRALVENHLISNDCADNVKNGALLPIEGQLANIMINEEDHLRIQAFRQGFDTEGALDLALETASAVEGTAELAYSESFGYLTCCPSNTGTGLRISAMLHLPALCITGNISPTVQAIGKIGLTVRGIYGEGSEALGNIYQLSNNITLGHSEKELLDSFNAACLQIIRNERLLRLLLFKNRREEIEDRIFRSWGLLSNAMMISTKELMNWLSDVRLGIYYKLFPELDESVPEAILSRALNGALQSRVNSPLSGSELRQERAKTIKSIIRGI